MDSRDFNAMVAKTRAAIDQQKKPEPEYTEFRLDVWNEKGFFGGVVREVEVHRIPKGPGGKFEVFRIPREESATMYAGPAPKGNTTMTTTGVYLSPSRKTDISPSLTCADYLKRAVPELAWRPCGKEDEKRYRCGADLPTGEWVQVRWCSFDKEYTVYVYAPDNKAPAAGVTDIDARACVVDALAQYQGSEGVLDTLYGKVPGVPRFVAARGKWTFCIALTLCVLTAWQAVEFSQASALKFWLYFASACVFAVAISIPFIVANESRNRRLAQARVTFNALVLSAAGAKTVDDMPVPAQAGTLALVDENKALRLARMLELAEAGGLPAREELARDDVVLADHPQGQDANLPSRRFEVRRHQETDTPRDVMDTPARNAPSASGERIERIVKPLEWPRQFNNEGLPSNCTPSPKPYFRGHGDGLPSNAERSAKPSRESIVKPLPPITLK